MMAGTYNELSLQIMGYKAPQDAYNEEYVALSELQLLHDKGISNRNVALIWNSSLGGSNKPKSIKGINKKGVKYNSIAYANTVMSYYDKE